MREMCLGNLLLLVTEPSSAFPCRYGKAHTIKSRPPVTSNLENAVHPRTDEPVRRNFLEVDTIWGLRAFELWQGDITRLPFPVDLLVLSAFQKDYTPTRTSVVGALDRIGIKVADLALRPEYDLRETPLSCWVSHTLDGPTMPAGDDRKEPRFRRFLCVEGLAVGMTPLERVTTSIFTVRAMLEGQGIEVRTMAMPVLGAGDQMRDPLAVIEAMTSAARRELSRSNTLERVVFVSFDPNSTAAFDQALEKKFERVQVRLEREMAIAKELLHQLERLLQLPLPKEAVEPLANLHRLMAREDSRAFELGVAGRKFAELLCRSILSPLSSKSSRNPVLLNMIENLGEAEVAEWIRSYLHTLRVFGNHAAHEKPAGNRQPAQLTPQDLIVWLHCLGRLLDYFEQTIGGELPFLYECQEHHG